MRRGVTCAALMAAFSAAGGEAWAQSGGVFLDWTRAEGAGDCIAQAELAARVEERLGRAVFSTDRAAGTVIAGSVERAAASPRWRGMLRVTRSDRAPESREIVSDAATCRPLSDAMTLVLSLLVAPLANPVAEPTPAAFGPGPPPPAAAGDLNPGRVEGGPGRVGSNLNPGRVERPRVEGPGRVGSSNLNPGRVEGGPADGAELSSGGAVGGRPAVRSRLGDRLRSQGVVGGGGGGEVNVGRGDDVGAGGERGGAWGWGGGVGSVLQVGALPGIALGPRVVARVVAPLAVPVALEVQGVWLLGSRAVIPQGRADFQVLLAGVAVCPGLVTTHLVRVGVCAGIDAGGVWARGSFEKDSYRQREAYGQATGGAWVSLRVHRWLSAGASGGVALPLLRHRFEWEMTLLPEGTKTIHVLHHTGPFAGQLELHLTAEIP